MTGPTGSGRQHSGAEQGQPVAVPGTPAAPAVGQTNPASAASIEDLERTLAGCQRSGDLTAQAGILARLAVAWRFAGDATQAGSAANEGERAARLVDDAHALGWTSLVQSSLAFDRGALELSFDYARAALARFGEEGNGADTWHALVACMRATKSLGRLKEAREYCLETIQCVEELGDVERASVLPEFAALVLALGDSSEALIVFAAGLIAGRRLGVTYPPTDLERFEARIATARERLPEADADAAWSQGEHLSPADALEQVRRCVNSGRTRTSLPA